jgi:phosphatidate phosphatase APP1
MHIPFYDILTVAIDSPHKGPLSRRNRILIGIARQLSGVPAPKGNNSTSRDGSPGPSLIRGRHESHEAHRDQERISREAEEILKKGAVTGDIAARGGYSETPTIEDSDSDSTYGDQNRSQTQGSTPNEDSTVPGSLYRRASWNQPSDMSPAELATANTNLMTRLMPFLTNPLVSTPVTIFYYNDKKSQSKTVMTDDAGHFDLRVSLDFIPTHVRVLASESLSVTEEIKITEPKGVSLISDVDDTIKHSSIGGGAREIFRNTFIRDFGDLTIDGVKEWYNALYSMGVGIHYVSNAPWQLFPVLMTFFRTAELPPGSYHLKQYSGMLQGIFEPVAERKKGTLEKIMHDFPERKFLLIGDSGEADLEVYTDVSVANPGRVIGIFIRDVSTPLDQGFFDSAIEALNGGRRKSRKSSRGWSGDSINSQSSTTPNSPEMPPAIPPRRVLIDTHPHSAGPTMGKLIDFDDEPEEISIDDPRKTFPSLSLSDLEQLDSRRKSAPTEAIKTAPARPVKPPALRSLTVSNSSPASARSSPLLPPLLPPRNPRSRPQTVNEESTFKHPLSQTQNTSEFATPNHNQVYLSSVRQRVASAYNALPAASTYLPSLPPRKPPSSPPLRSGLDHEHSAQSHRATATTTSRSSNATNRLSWPAKSQDNSDDELYSYTSPPLSPRMEPTNKKVELWKRRWRRAKAILDEHSVELRSWRTGQDICGDACKLVERAMREMGVEGYGPNGVGKGNTGSSGGEMEVKDFRT